MNSGSKPTRYRVKLACLAAIAVGLLCLGSTVIGQEIYKQVLPDGSVVYSDQRPTPNAEPIVLPELTLVAGGTNQSTNRASRSNDQDAQSDERPSLQFTLLEPTPDQTYWNTAYTLTARVSDIGRLSSTHRVRFLVDGELRGESRSSSLLLTDVYRGEHAIQAELINSRGVVVATTDSVTFHMKQTSSRQ